MEEPKTKQFPLKTRGRCLICFRVASKQCPSEMKAFGIEGEEELVSLAVFCRHLNINVKDVYFKGLKMKAGSPAGAALDGVELDMKAQLCGNCARQIADTIGCFRRLEEVKIEISNCLKKIRDEIVETNGKVTAMELYRQAMMDDKFSRPYLGIVEELRKEIEGKCLKPGPEASENARATVATERIKQYSRTTNKSDNILTVPPKNISYRLRKRPEVVSVSSSSSDEDEIKMEPKQEEDVKLDIQDEIPSPEDYNQTEPEPTFGIEEPIIISNDAMEKPDQMGTIDPLLVVDVDIKEETESPIAEVPAESNATNAIVSKLVKCQICKIELSPSLEVLQHHFSEAHPNVKVVKKCALCKQVISGNHTCGKAQPKQPKSLKKKPKTTVTKASPKQPPTTKNSTVNTRRKTEATSDENPPPIKKRGRPKKPPKVSKRKVNPSDPLSHIPWRGRGVEVTYKCHICSKIFKGRGSLRAHHYGIHLKIQRRRYACDQCDVSYTKKFRLERHKQVIHLGIGKYNSSTNNFEKLNRPPPSPDGDETSTKVKRKKYQLKCLHGCGKEFVYHVDRHAHHAMDHIGKVFMCDACGKSFAMKKQLNFHTRIYHDGRRHVCEHCGKDFITNRNLQSHIQAIHLGVKFKCQFPGCGKTFKWKTNRRSHYKTYHQIDKVESDKKVND